jgi:hypothetical protein
MNIHQCKSLFKASRLSTLFGEWYSDCEASRREAAMADERPQSRPSDKDEEPQHPKTPDVPHTPGKSEGDEATVDEALRNARNEQ